MPIGSTPDMLVVLDDHPSSRAGLIIAERYARGIVALASWDTATDHVDAEIRTSITSEPTIAEAVRVATTRHTPWIALRRDMGEPEWMLGELLVAAGQNANDDTPGLAVILADGEPRPFRRILAIVDRGAGPVSGLLAYIAVAVAEVAGAELDVLLLGNPPDVDVDARPSTTVVVNREQELLESARERADRAGLSANWIMLTTDADPWSVILDQLGQYDYDLIIDDLGDVDLGRSGKAAQVADSTLQAGQIGEIPVRLLREVPVPLLLVIDEIRLGVSSPGVLKVGAAAALAIGLASTATLTSGTAAPVTVAAESAPEELAQELEIALGMTEDPSAAAAEDRQAQAERSSRGGDDGGARDAAEKPAPKAPKGGADPGDVAKAQRQASQQKADLDKDKAKRDKTKETLDQAEADLGQAQEDAEAALDELNAATMALAEAEQHLEEVRSEASGLTGILPSSPDDADVAEAEQVEQAARARLDTAMLQGATALDAIGEAETRVANAEARLDKRKGDLQQSRASYDRAQERVQVYKESLAKTRQSPVAGGYRLTARFGDTGGYWSSGVHSGLDFAAPSGTDIRAAASGTVISAGWEGSYGNKIEIRHSNGYVTTYSHLSDIDVRVGQKVQTGDHIGDMGSTGNSTGPHLHFEVIKDGRFIDPEGWLW